MQEVSIYRLTDEQWDTMLLAVPKLNVRDRHVFEAILHVLSTALPWQDMPEDFGITSRTAWNRYQKWQEQAIWDDLLGSFLGCFQHHVRMGWERTLREAALQRAQKFGTRKRPLVQEMVTIPVLVTDN